VRKSISKNEDGDCEDDGSEDSGSEGIPFRQFFGERVENFGSEALCSIISRKGVNRAGLGTEPPLMQITIDLNHLATKCKGNGTNRKTSPKSLFQQRPGTVVFMVGVLYIFQVKVRIWTTGLN
jgi:hypothetical protein